MRKLTKEQSNRLSEVSGNITVAWFSAGVISPLFVRPRTAIDFLVGFVLSLLMAGAFLAGSLSLAKGEK